MAAKVMFFLEKNSTFVFDKGKNTKIIIKL